MNSRVPGGPVSSREIGPPSGSTTIGLLCALIVASAVAQSTLAFAMQHKAAGADHAALVLPTRRAPDAPPEPPPALPPGARVTPFTLEVVIHLQEGTGYRSTFRRRISRTTDRIHVAENDGREWLFERNTIDPRRASGAFVDHRERLIVVYDESAL